MIGIIPAAGYGKRLAGTGKALPKCLLSVGGETLLDRALDHLRSVGIDRFVVVVGHLGDLVRDHLSHRKDVEIRLWRQRDLTGLVSALGEVRHLVKEPSVVYCPDNYIADKHDIELACSEFKRAGPDVLVCSEETVVRAFRPQLIGSSGREEGAGFRVDRIELSSGKRGWTSTGISFQTERMLETCAHGAIEVVDGERRLFQVWKKIIEDGGTVFAHRLAGRRLDISTEDDLAAANSEFDSRSGGVAVIVIVAGDRYLLVERDNKPGIRYPGYWSLFGGSIEKGESPEVAARRELDEEIGLRPDVLVPVCRYNNNLKSEYVFVTRTNADPASLTLTEGRRFAVFSRDEVEKLKIRPDDMYGIKKYWGGCAG